MPRKGRTVSELALWPLALRAEQAARTHERGTSPDRRVVFRNFASDLRVLAALPSVAPRVLGYIDRECLTREDWLCAARAVAARYGLNLEMREQLTLRLTDAA